MWSRGGCRKPPAKSAYWPEYDYVIVNRDVEASHAALSAILAAERLKRRRNSACRTSCAAFWTRCEPRGAQVRIVLRHHTRISARPTRPRSSRHFALTSAPARALPSRSRQGSRTHGTRLSRAPSPPAPAVAPDRAASRIHRCHPVRGAAWGNGAPQTRDRQGLRALPPWRPRVCGAKIREARISASRTVTADVAASFTCRRRHDRLYHHHRHHQHRQPRTVARRGCRQENTHGRADRHRHRPWSLALAEPGSRPLRTGRPHFAWKREVCGVVRARAARLVL